MEAQGVLPGAAGLVAGERVCVRTAPGRYTASVVLGEPELRGGELCVPCAHFGWHPRRCVLTPAELSARTRSALALPDCAGDGAGEEA